AFLRCSLRLPAHSAFHPVPARLRRACSNSRTQAMEMKDEIRIEAPRDRVYVALNDPDVLKACIPGCEELTKTSDDKLEAKVTLKIGPVKAKFGGAVTLDNSNAPERFSLTGEDSGGVA